MLSAFSRIALAAALAASPLFAVAADSAPAKAKSTGGYGVYRDEGITEFDNPRDTGVIEDMLDLTDHLLRTAVKISKYRRPAALPMVNRVPRPVLEGLACPGGTHCGVSAMYEPTRGILFAEDLRPETNLFHRSILLHEMIHYLQDVGHELSTMAACERWYQRELEAYALQKQYLQNVHSPDRVAYSGARPVCDQLPVGGSLTHSAKPVKAPGVND
jgi:hypothetical protein